MWNGKPDSWQMERHAEKMKQAASGGVKVVFIGGSITNGWEQKGRRILDVIALKQPQAKVLLLPIFVRGEGPQNVQRKANEEVNAAIQKFADGEKVVWVDFNAKYLDAKDDTKWIMPDRTHPNAAGYKIWADAVLPYFKKYCGK